MKIIAHARELGSRKVCLAIGVFEGVHLGHQQVLRQTTTDAHQHRALAVAITFDRHPNAVVAPGRTPPLIHSLPQKLRSISAMGVDATLLIEFTAEFAAQPAEDFIRGLVREAGQIHSVCVGAQFTFGHRRSGNVELLKLLGRELNFTVHGLAAVALDGEKVSSTRIREAIRGGNLDAASQMLGRPYSTAGTVVQGDGLGRKIGVPTANLDHAGLILPPPGVYAAHAMLGNQIYPTALNIGFRPTLGRPDPQLRVEAHLIDFDGDLYGRDLEVTFVEKIRDEMKFASIDDLRNQIERDISTARTLLD